MDIKTFNRGCGLVEEGFNFVECVPLVGMVSSALRVKVAHVQVCAGLVTLAAGGLGLLFTSCSGSESGQIKSKAIARLGAEHIIHGALNILRGLGVLLIGSCTLGFGNLVMIPVNLCNQNKPFSPFFNYGYYTDFKPASLSC